MQKRYRIQDLSPTRSTQAGPQIGARDVYQDTTLNLNGATAARPVDIGPLGDQVLGIVQEEQKERRRLAQESGQQFGRDRANSDAVATLQEELAKVGEGITDDAELAKRQKGVLRTLREQGVIPDQADPVWLIGVAQAETERAMRQSARELMAGVGQYTAIEDGDGNLIVPEDAEEFAAAKRAELLASPLVSQSLTARELVDEFWPEIEGSFLDTIGEQRAGAQSARARSLRVNELATGFNRPGFEATGMRSLMDPSVGPLTAAKSFQDGVQYLREVENVGDPLELVMATATQISESDLEDDPEGVQRMLDIVGEIEITPGLPIENDSRPEAQAIHGLRRRAERAALEAAREENDAMGVLTSNISRVARGLQEEILADSGDVTSERAFRDTVERLLEDPTARAALGQAGLDAPPEWLLGTLRRTLSADFNQRGTLDAAEDERIMSRLTAMQRAGTPDLIVAAFAGDQLSAAGLRQWTKDEPGKVWNALRQSPGMRQLDAVVSDKAIPRNVNPADYTSLQKEGSELLSYVQQRALDLKRKGEEPTDVWALPDVQEKLRARETKLRGFEEQIQEGVSEFNIALSRGDSEAMDEALSKLRGRVEQSVITDLRSKRDRTASTQENRLLGNLRYQNSLRAIDSVIQDLAETEGLSAEVTSALKAEVVDSFRERALAGAKETQSLAPEEQIVATNRAIRDAMLESMDPYLKDEDKKTLRLAAEVGPRKAARNRQGALDYRAYVNSGSVPAAVALTMGPVPEWLGDPQSTIGFFESSTPERVFGRTARYTIGQEIRDASLADTVPEEFAQRLTSLALLSGVQSPEDFMAGKPIQVDISKGDIGNLDRSWGGDLLVLTQATNEKADLRRARLQAALSASDSVITFDSKDGVKLTLTPDYDQANTHLSLFFQTGKAVDEWIANTPEADRMTFFTKLGLDTADPAQATVEFRRRQLLRLKDFNEN